MTALQDRVTLTDAAEVFLANVGGGRRLLILAALIAKDESREVLRLGDFLAAHERYWSHLASGHELFWQALEELFTQEDDDDSH